MVHVSYSELAQAIQVISDQIPINSQRYHYKDTTVAYVIRDIIIDEATDSPAVVYQKIWDIHGVKFVRLASIFLEKIWDQERFVRIVDEVSTYL